MKIDHKDSYLDFGEQFEIDNKIDGYHGSKEMLKEIVHPFDLKLIKNKVIMEVGSGSGRILKNLLKFKPKKITGVEPSKAINIARKNNNESKKIIFKNIKGEDIKDLKKYDFVFSLGVIHHIPNYKKVCKNIYNSLKTNGKFICWVYGYEGNELYIFIFNNLRRLTILMPDFLLRYLCNFLNAILYIYIFLCKLFPLPLKDYLLNVFAKCSYSKRNYIIFDQLNPSFSKYFKKEEISKLMKKSGFKQVKVYSRHKYSWTIISKK
jgi:SAM-dependent methyltransferase